MTKGKLSSEWRDASSVRNIKAFIQASELKPELLHWLESDRRSGVRALASQVSRKLKRVNAENRRLADMMKFERKLLHGGYRFIAGVDEVGAGPLAGPVVAAAAIMDFSHLVHDVKDSKRLSERQRTRIESELRSEAKAVAFGWVDPQEIDEVNIYQASLLAMRRAVEGLDIAPDHLLVDARTVPGMKCPQEAIIGGDNVSYAIAAASILAKQARDRYMVEVDSSYPDYGFAAHKGYGTSRHLEALKRFGPCPLHRKSFAPVSASLI